MNNVGLIIKKKREAIGISQNQLAKKANIAQASLNALESKVNNPRVYTLYQLADALDCSVSELLGETPAAATVLSPRQQMLLDLFAQLNDAGKDFLIAQAEQIIRQPAFREDGSVHMAKLQSYNGG